VIRSDRNLHRFIRRGCRAKVTEARKALTEIATIGDRGHRGHTEALRAEGAAQCSEVRLDDLDRCAVLARGHLGKTESRPGKDLQRSVTKFSGQGQGPLGVVDRLPQGACPPGVCRAVAPHARQTGLVVQPTRQSFSVTEGSIHLGELSKKDVTTLELEAQSKGWSHCAVPLP